MELEDDAAADPRHPCPRCGGLIRPGARKCPHCRRYLDAQLADDRWDQIDGQVAYEVEAKILTEKVTTSAIATAIASFILCFAGALGGPVVLGYALYYQHRARVIQMPELPRIRLMFAFAGLWTATGVLTVALWWWWVANH